MKILKKDYFNKNKSFNLDIIIYKYDFFVLYKFLTKNKYLILFIYFNKKCIEYFAFFMKICYK